MSNLFWANNSYERGDIFWANVELVKQPGVFERHPVMFYKEIETEINGKIEVEIVVFGGTSNPDKDFKLLRMVDFGQRLRHFAFAQFNHIDKKTYFYHEFIQSIKPDAVLSEPLACLDDDDYWGILEAAGVEKRPPTA